jgi:eukaryotic-like serine/threonine-protein kinase
MTTPIPPIPLSGGAVRSPRGPSYLLGRRLGNGAFGAVFDCIGPFDQSFALKVFLPGHRPYTEVRAEWLKEAERLYRLRHPNIVYVHDYFEAQGLFYLVLERCDHSLDEMLTAPFTDRLVVDIARQLLFAVQYLADNEFVHNDLHAGNVLVVQGEHLTAKLSDLGIAQELYGYVGARPPIVHHRLMAPEVAGGGYSTRQSDLYQLGLLIYQMHTGVYPIDTSVGYDGIIAQIRDGVPRAKAEALGTPIGDVVSVMLRRQEQYRYTSALQVWEDLQKLDVWSRDRVLRTGEIPRMEPSPESPKQNG